MLEKYPKYVLPPLWIRTGFPEIAVANLYRVLKRKKRKKQKKKQNSFKLVHIFKSSHSRRTIVGSLSVGVSKPITASSMWSEI